MIKTLLSFMLAAQTVLAAPVIFSGNDVKTLKPSIDLNGQSKIQSGTVDPTATATSAPIGSIYLNSSTGTAYRKLDAGSTTNWANLATGAIAQASMIGSIKISGCSNSWQTTSTTFASFSPVTGCSYATTGSAQAPSTMIPAITFASLPAGELLFVFDGLIGDQASNAITSFRIFDGTNVGREVPSIYSGNGSSYSSTFTSSINYSTPQSNVTLQIQGLGSATSIATINGSAAFPAVIKVYYFPSQAQTVLTPALTPAYAGKQWLGATAGSAIVGASAAASNTRTVFSAASFATYNLLGSAQNDASTNLQVTSTLPAGEYEVEYSGFMRAFSSAGGTTTNCVFELYDGTTVLGANFVSSTAQASANFQDTTHIRGYFKLSGPTTKTVQLRVAKTQGDTSANSGCQAYADTSAATTGSIPMLTIAPRTQSVPMPVIANSVISSSAGVERVERVVFGGASGTPTSPTNCTTSPCTIVSQTGNWVTSVTRTGAAQYVLNHNFASYPTCTCSSQAVGNKPLECMAQPTGVSTISIVNLNNTTSAFDLDAQVNVICQGPK